jgi:hypothetical protein
MIFSDIKFIYTTMASLRDICHLSLLYLMLQAPLLLLGPPNPYLRPYCPPPQSLSAPESSAQAIIYPK